MKMKQQELLPDDVMAEWEDLGFQLDFTANQLDTISSNHDEKAVETCCKEMLKKWSRQYKLPSPQAAKQLITAIHKADNNYYAEQLKTGECLYTLHSSVLCYSTQRYKEDKNLVKNTY